MFGVGKGIVAIAAAMFFIVLANALYAWRRRPRRGDGGR